MTGTSHCESGRTAKTKARKEAAVWFERLDRPRVSVAQLDAFFAWRTVTLNDEAYSAIAAESFGAILGTREVRAHRESPSGF